MTIYRFSEPSVIDEIAVRHSAGGGVRAYIHARAGADPKTLEAIKNSLTQKSMKWTPLEHEGKATLEVRGIGKDGSKLLKFLADQGMTTGAPKKEVNPENKVKWQDKLRQNSLRLVGLFYEVGDAGFLFKGLKEAFISTKPKDLFKWSNLADPQDLFAGIFYALGSPIALIFGKGDKSDVQLRHMSYDTLNYLESKGIEVPADASIRSITYKHNSNLARKVKGKLERYPAEITNSLFGLAGVMMLWAGFKKRQNIKSGKSYKSVSSAFIDIGIGIATIAAGLVSVFVQEEPRQPGEPKKTGLAGVWQYIKEKPLRTAGTLLGLSTVGHTVSSVTAYNKAKKLLDNPSGVPPEWLNEAASDRQGLKGHMLFAGTNIGAEISMFFSSKGHGEGVESDPSLKPSSYAVIADLIERSPPEKREQILDLTSSYLSLKENLNIPKEEIKAGIEKQMEETRVNPWLGVSVRPDATDKIAQDEVPQPEMAWQNLAEKTSRSDAIDKIVRDEVPKSDAEWQRFAEKADESDLSSAATR